MPKKFSALAVNKVFEHLMRTMKSFQWHEIVAAVKAEHIEVDNWMKVRGILQSYLNNGKLTRDQSNLRLEKYDVVD